MANVKTVSFGGGGANADLQARENELARRQQMIDALRQQSMTPVDQQTVSGRVVKNSPWEYVGKLAQMGASMYAQNKSDTGAKELATERAKRSSEALKAMAPAGVFDNSAPMPQRATPGAGASYGGDDYVQAAMAAKLPNPDSRETLNRIVDGVNNGGGTPQQVAMTLANGPQQQQTSVSPEMKEAWIRALKVSEQNPELGQKMILNLTDLTNEQKDMNAQGIDPKLFGAARMAKARADGLVSVAPNSTLYNAGTNAPQFAGPDFNSGRNNAFGPNGQPQVSRMQGAEVIPQMAGEIKGAEAAAQAANEMITVDTPQGPRMMTKAQAVQMAGSQPQAPAAAAPANPGTFTASNGVVVNLANSTPEQLFAAAKASGDPRDMQAAQEFAQRQAQPAPAAPGGPGIALQSAAQKEAEVGAVRMQHAVEQSRILAAQAPEELAKIKDAGSTLALLDMAEPLLKQATGSGVGAIRDKVGNLVGASSKASQAAAQLAVIGASLTSKVPKMSGPTSDKDMALYKEAAGSLGDPNVPGEQKAASMQIMRFINEKYAKENQGSVAGKAADANRAGIGTPSVDDLLKKYGGQ
jgi:hypothetical protein